MAMNLHARALELVANLLKKLIETVAEKMNIKHMLLTIVND